ncbi:TlyA family RNA methyltransferase [Oceanobacillus sp. CAU 1775]
MAKIKLYELLVKNNLVEDEEKAKRLIMAGLVFTDQTRLDKPGMQIDEATPVYVKNKTKNYVSRGGQKLEKAIQDFSLNMENKILIDVGSSTGGFTDCALQNGAKLSYAIDVGYNQLDWKLRNDSRVVVMERTNFRHVTEDMLQMGKPHIATIDVSFISLKKILPVLKKLLAKENDIVALIKPQFEARKEQVGDGGIIRDKEVHLQVLNEITTFAQNEGYQLMNVTFSPITGGHGNIEFLAHFKYNSSTLQNHDTNYLQEVVAEAHLKLLHATK